MPLESCFLCCVVLDIALDCYGFSLVCLDEPHLQSGCLHDIRTSERPWYRRRSLLAGDRATKQRRGACNFTVSSAPSRIRSTTCTSGMPQHRMPRSTVETCCQPQVIIELERHGKNDDRYLASSGCQGDAQSAANARASPSDKDCLTSPFHCAIRLAYKRCFVTGTRTNEMRFCEQKRL